MAALPDNPDKPVPECLHFRFYWNKNDGDGGDNRRYKMSKAPVKPSPPTNEHPAFYRPDALPVTHPTVSEHWMKKYHIEWTCSLQAHLGLPTLSLTTKGSWLVWGKVANCTSNYILQPFKTYLSFCCILELLAEWTLDPGHGGGLQCKAIFSLRLWVSAHLWAACGVIPRQRRPESSREGQTWLQQLPRQCCHQQQLHRGHLLRQPQRWQRWQQSVLYQFCCDWETFLLLSVAFSALTGQMDIYLPV